MVPLIVRVEDSENQSAVEYSFMRSPVRIGRSARNDLCLAQPFVSAWHGVIEFDDDGASYRDLGSTNGTLLNGAQLAARDVRALGAGDEVVIGTVRFTFPPRNAAAGARAGPAGDGAPLLAPGGITALMKQLAAAPSTELDGAWRRVLVPGAVIGRFELHHEVGRGSFGVVFEAKDRQLGRLVAFKAVRPGRESQMMFREELLQKEAEAVAQLNHPNIVSLYDAGTCQAGPYLIMELLRGETLRDRLERGRLPVQKAVEVAIEIAWALDHAHAASVIHRDLKPANVFLCASGQVKVLDFGIAHVFGAGASRAVGTPAYMAPEQWRQEKQDTRTDVFGAAAMLAETVTGHLPYHATKEHSAVLDPGARPSLGGGDAPPKLLALLRRALAPDPRERPADGHAWLTALLEIHESLDATPAFGSQAAPDEPRDRSAVRAEARAARGARAPASPGSDRRGRIILAATLAAATLLTALAYHLLG